MKLKAISLCFSPHIYIYFCYVKQQVSAIAVTIAQHQHMSDMLIYSRRKTHLMSDMLIYSERKTHHMSDMLAYCKGKAHHMSDMLAYRKRIILPHVRYAEKSQVKNPPHVRYVDILQKKNPPNVRYVDI